MSATMHPQESHEQLTLLAQVGETCTSKQNGTQKKKKKTYVEFTCLCRTAHPKEASHLPTFHLVCGYLQKPLLSEHSLSRACVDLLHRLRGRSIPELSHMIVRQDTSVHSSRRRRRPDLRDVANCGTMAKDPTRESISKSGIWVQAPYRKPLWFACYMLVLPLGSPNLTFGPSSTVARWKVHGKPVPW